MYIPPAFKDTELASIHATIHSARLASFVTCTANGLVCTPLPLFLDEREGEQGVIYGHLARANAQWTETPTCDALAIFSGPDAYVTPSWYQSKKEHGKVVPTWNYAAVHAYGAVEFFEDPDRLYDVITRLTDLYERPRAPSWAVTRRTGRLHQGAASRNRRPANADLAHRREAKDEPEPQRVRPGRRRSRSGRKRPGIRSPCRDDGRALRRRS